MNGTLQPGNPTQAGTLSTNTDLAFGAGSTLKINELGAVSSEVSVNGPASLTGASLSVSFADIVTTGTQYVIVNASGGLGGTTFTGLPDGSTVTDTTNGQVFGVHYTADEVILTKEGGGAPAPTITDVVLNQDITALNSAITGSAQRSMVEDIVYTFSAPVNIVSNTVDPNLFHITALTVNGVTGVVPSIIEWAPVAGSGNLQWEVDFGVNLDATNSQVGALNSIANGCYTVTITNFSEITAVTGGTAANINTGPAPGIASSTLPGYSAANANYATQSFYRLFGDGNGDFVVNPGDNNRFKQAITTYNSAFDFNQDGVVNPGDNNRFKANLTVNFLGFTETI